MSSSSMVYNQAPSYRALVDFRLDEEAQFLSLRRYKSLYSKKEIEDYVRIEEKLIDDKVVLHTECDIYGNRRQNLYKTYRPFLLASRLQLSCSSSDRIIQNCDPEHIKYRFRPIDLNEVKIPLDATCCAFEGQEEAFKQARDAWVISPFCQELRRYITDSCKTPIKSIVCFGLGRLANHKISLRKEHEYSGYLRHIAALEIRRIFQTPGDPLIPIYVVDPRQCPTCMETLYKVHEMETYSPAKAFSVIDANTFIITKKSPSRFGRLLQI